MSLLGRLSPERARSEATEGTSALSASSESPRGSRCPSSNAWRLQAGVASAKARTHDTVPPYQQAPCEVADAPMIPEQNREFWVQREFLVQTLRTAVQLATVRYQVGASYLEVLDA
jgi:hypothetical protein